MINAVSALDELLFSPDAKTTWGPSVLLPKSNSMKLPALFSFLMAMAFCSHGQDVYWVTESNANVPRQTKVRIYDLNQVLLAEYDLDRDIKLFRKRDKRILNRLAQKARAERNDASSRKTRKGRPTLRVSKV